MNEKDKDGEGEENEEVYVDSCDIVCSGLLIGAWAILFYLLWLTLATLPTVLWAFFATVLIGCLVVVTICFGGRKGR